MGAVTVGAVTVDAVTVDAVSVGAVTVGAVSVGAVTVGAVSVGAVNVGALLESRRWFSCAETRTPSDLEWSCADESSLHAVLGASGVGSDRYREFLFVLKKYK